MKIFFKAFPQLTLIAIGIGILLYLLLRTQKLKTNFSWLRIPFSFLVLVLLGWGYLNQSVYYFPYNGGVVGDNYLYMMHSLENSNYANPQHFIYPTVPGNMVKLAEKTGLLDRNSPQFYEEAFALSTIPTRVLCVLALIAFLFALKVCGAPMEVALIGTLFMGSTFGFWLWGIQSNALGCALALQLMSASALMVWDKRRHLYLLFIAAALNCLCIYTHISTLYFVIGNFLSIILLSRKAKDWAVHLSTTFSLGIIYFYLCGLRYDNYNASYIFHAIAGTADAGAGDFKFQWDKLIPYSFKNLSLGMAQITNYWLTIYSWSKALNFIELVLITALSLSLLWNFRQSLKRIPRSALYVFLFGSLFTLLGFDLRQPASHYYIAALVPNAGLLLCLLLFPIQNQQENARRTILLSMLSLCFFIFTGFSEQSVLKAKNLDDNVAYRDQRIIQSLLLPDEFGTHLITPPSGYVVMAITTYYKFKFKNVKLDADFSSGYIDPKRVYDRIDSLLAKNNQRIFADDGIMQILAPLSPTLQKTNITNGIWEIRPVDKKQNRVATGKM